MSLTPLDIRKMTFPTRMRGADPAEVERFLDLVAEELTGRLGEIARLEQENRDYARRLEQAAERQQALQEAMLQAQKLSQEITDSARREAELLVKEAEITAESIVSQAIEQANKIEAKILELRAMRRDLQLKFKNTLDLFQRILEAEMDDESRTATVRTLRRRRTS
ncbi:MAG: DivIVA domain-containing protein [Acidobacteria bacterium]|nr:MAG: DivIVA domain-containing protein [Acidobacteriota bacterium]